MKLRKHRGSRHTGWWNFRILQSIKPINDNSYDIISNLTLSKNKKFTKKQ